MGGPRNRGNGRSLKDLKREMKAKNSEAGGGGGRQRATEGVDEPGGCGAPRVSATTEPWTPSSYTAWKLVLSARLCAAVWSGVSDCDETYNYWEPTHHLIYGQGMQTWEYDPKYALRSYMYLLVHALPAWLYAKLLQPNPMLVFYFLRCLLGCVSASCEVYFYRGVLAEFGANVGRLCLALLTLSAGMYVASTAFLPSTTSMYLAMLSYGAWFSQQYRLAIFTTALSTFLSWPFAALLGLPIALDMLLLRKEFKVFLVWSLISAFTILGPLIMCDTFYYGKPVFAAFNIVKYNIFTSHGPDLYGTEPATYYLFNGILNFNLIFPAALCVLPVQLLVNFLLRKETPAPLAGSSIPFSLTQAPLYLWLLVFWTQPHKEERFLFPVYPLICLAGALVIDSAQKLWYYLFIPHKSKHFLQETSWLAVVVLSLFSLLSLSRVTALYQHYQATTDVWMLVAQLEDSQHPTTVCLGKEWHRFPSSFYLPSNSFRIGFLQSEFRGQLPKYYMRSPDSRQLPTQLTHEDFNDQNLEEPTRYIPHPGKCHFIVDLNNDAVSSRQPRYYGHANWTVEAEFEFLDPAASHPFFRAFFVPVLNRRFCRYHQYLLLRRATPRRTSPAED